MRAPTTTRALVHLGRTFLSQLSVLVPSKTKQHAGTKRGCFPACRGTRDALPESPNLARTGPTKRPPQAFVHISGNLALGPRRQYPPTYIPSTFECSHFPEYRPSVSFRRCVCRRAVVFGDYVYLYVGARRGLQNSGKYGWYVCRSNGSRIAASYFASSMAIM